MVAPLKNDPILLGRLIQSFRHLEHQNLSTIADLRETGKSEEQEEQEDPIIIEEDISLSDRVPKKGISNDLELEGGL